MRGRPGSLPVAICRGAGARGVGSDAGSGEAAGVMVSRVSAGEYIDLLSARFYISKTRASFSPISHGVYCINVQVDSWGGVNCDSKSSLKYGIVVGKISGPAGPH